MRRLITYSILPIIVIVLTAYRVNDKLLNDPVSNLTKYYFHEQNCLNVTKRCDLEIMKLINTDTIIYGKSSEYFGNYEEVWGKLTKINDSIYYVKSFRAIQQSETMPYYGISDDTLTFYCDSALVGKNFKIEYLNKKTESHKIYSTTNRFHIDKTSFNSESKTAIVSFDYLHPIINETVELKVSYHSDLHFTESKGLNDFYLVFKPTTITTLNFQSSYGPKFTLKQMRPIDKLNRGRTIR